MIKASADATPRRDLVCGILIPDTGLAIVGQGLGGLPAGSSVLLAILLLPGYGPNGHPYVSGADTLVFVIDIVAALGPTAKAKGV